MEGLRERKKRRTRQSVSDAAIALFLARGFDQVSVAEVATAAEVSRRTLFSYFPTKEDLVLHRFADHEDEAARVVRERPAGESPLGALHRHFADGLRQRDPITGLTDDPEAHAVYRMVSETPALAARLLHYLARSEHALTEALREAGGDPLTARLAAGQIVAVQRVLAEENGRRLADGAAADARYPDAVAHADHAFSLLRDGLGRCYA